LEHLLDPQIQNTSGDKDRAHSILDFCSSSGTGAGTGEEGRGGGMLKRNGSVLMKYLRGSDEKELTGITVETFEGRDLT
jgi:hypothetical protein